MSRYTIDPNSREIQIVGFLDTTLMNRHFGTNLPSGEVRLYPGVIKHIKKKHEDTWNNHYHRIPGMIENPKYIGQHPGEKNSTELVIQVDCYLQLAIKYDPEREYLYVSSFYDLQNGEVKVQKRLRSGRLIQIIPDDGSSNSCV